MIYVEGKELFSH